MRKEFKQLIIAILAMWIMALICNKSHAQASSGPVCSARVRCQGIQSGGLTQFKFNLQNFNVVTGYYDSLGTGPGSLPHNTIPLTLANTFNVRCDNSATFNESAYDEYAIETNLGFFSSSSFHIIQYYQVADFQSIIMTGTRNGCVYLFVSH